ncbi:MAG: FkbM family methyltransferase [Methylacidiphilales bacterium]|nr:FkbM family methyltransferase [Candidatus Methylacidiphilales bacterium]
MIKRLIDQVVLALFFRVFLRESPSLITIGTECPWTFDPRGLGPASRVLSAGVGGDITFELELVKRYGCQVLLMDPSPTGAATIDKLQPLPPEIAFLPAGLAGKSETHRFSAPIYADEGSFRLATGLDTEGQYQWECYGIEDVLKKRGWSSIDLLKMDIESFEYEVLSHLPVETIPIKQICVEFHFGEGYPHRFRHVISSILRLHRQGYRLVHRFMRDYTFLKGDSSESSER